MNRTEAIEIVTRYLEAATARRLDEARAYLAGGAEFIFPDGRFRNLEEMAASASRRYRWVKKTCESWDVAERDDGAIVVFSTGTLCGENLHGVPFEGIRYIDRFVIRDGKIMSQQVWNDLDASGVLTRPIPF